MGWIGWTYDQTLDTPMPAIELAYHGRHDMLSAIFGSGDSSPRPPSNRQLTSELFDALF